MYICESCKREWDKETAQENEYLCTRKCNGRLVVKEEYSMEQMAKNIARIYDDVART